MNDTSAIPKDAFFTANESSISHNATLGVPKLGSRGRYKDVQGDITPCRSSRRVSSRDIFGAVRQGLRAALLKEHVLLQFNNYLTTETLTPLPTTVVLNHPLGKRAAEPCAQGKPCPDKRYDISS